MKAVKVITGADLRAMHPGLKKLAARFDIDLGNLKDGEAVLFINRAKDKLKSYSSNGVVSYVRFDDKKRSIDMDALNEIPRSFNSDGSLDYNRALKSALTKKLKSCRKFDDVELV